MAGAHHARGEGQVVFRTEGRRAGVQGHRGLHLFAALSELHHVLDELAEPEIGVVAARRHRGLARSKERELMRPSGTQTSPNTMTFIAFHNMCSLIFIDFHFSLSSERGDISFHIISSHAWWK